MKTRNFLKSGLRNLTFNRWSRKPYASFMSLKSVVKISVLAGTFTILALPQKGYSQQDTIKINNHLDIDEVVVSATRTPKLYREMSRVVSIIPSSEIISSPAQSLQELLKFALNVDVRQRGANGVQADVSIRGGSFEQTLFLLNGIPVNDPQTGHHNLNIPIDLESIERIEILQGPGTRIYGPNAFTGAINIITNSTTDRNIRASISGGQHGLFNGSAAINLSTGKLNNFFSGAYSTSDGYTENTDFKSYNLFYRGTLELKAGTFNAQAGYLNKAFGAHGFYTQKYPDQYEQVKNIITSLGYNKNFKALSVNTNAYWRRNHDRFELFREDTYQYQDGYFVTQNNDTAKYYDGIYEPWNYYSKHNYHQTDVAGANANLSLSWFAGKTSVGVDYRYEHIFSNVLGEEMDTTISVPNEERGLFNKEADRTHMNYFLEHNYIYKNIDITAGVLIHDNSDYGTHINGGIDISYGFTKNTRIFASVNQSLRTPTFTDLYYNGPNNIGNPELKPEKAISYELGLKGFSNHFQWHAASFIRDVSDAIDWVKYPSEKKFTTTNFTKLTTYGIEFAGKYAPDKSLPISKVINYVSFNNSFIYIDKYKQDSVISAYALDYLKNKYSITADFKLYRELGLRCDITIQDRNGTYSQDEDIEIEYTPYALFDARLYYRKPRFEVYAQGTNLLNIEYVDLGGIIQPGTWIKAGIKANIGFK